MAGRQRRKRLLVLSPFGAKGGLPVDVRLNTITVTDMHCRGAAQPSIGPLQGVDAPRRDLVHVDVEGRLIELDHIDAIGSAARGPPD